jgi:tetratricopeptide (TPR) repeat protein
MTLQGKANMGLFKRQGEVVIMCVGESTTGLGGEYSYPRQLERILNEKNLGKRVSIINKGIPGGESSTILRQLKDNLDKYYPDIVIAMMGINDNSNTSTYSKSKQPGFKHILSSLRISKLFKLLRMHIYLTVRRDGSPSSEEIKGVRTIANASDLSYQAEKSKLKKAILNNPRDRDSYVRIGDLYLDNEQYNQALKNFKKAIELGPEDYEVLIKIIDSCFEGEAHRNPEKKQIAKSAFTKAVNLRKNDYRAYLAYGNICRWRQEWQAAIPLLDRAFRLCSEQGQKFWIQVWLGYCYQALHNYPEAEKILKEVIKERPGYERAYGSLAFCYDAQGKHDLADEYYRKSRDLLPQDRYYPTKVNYREMRRILDERGIQLVCVQYPMRNLEDLKRYFFEKGNIIFVDNQGVFKKAVIKDGYNEYFIDLFAGDFGHCTPKGNHLLAETV